LIGFSFAVGWTPCVGPILGAILALASSAAHMTSGLLLLGAYSIGLGVPFLLSTLAINAFCHIFLRFKRDIEILHTGGGSLLMAIGMLIFTDYLTVLNTWAIQLTPAWLWERL
jgi:cytochrome c-type biogenesis protein